MPARGNFKDLKGMRFGRLKVLQFSERKNYILYWDCLCDCGNIKTINGTHLKAGKINSCGCLIKENTKLMGLNNKTHGLKNDKLYKLWGSIKTRCYNKNSSSYKNYGARCITMCDEWLKNPEKFRDWALLNGYKKGLQIDRIDNYSGYSPDNCRFVTCKQNCNNKRNNAKIENRKCINCDKNFSFKVFKTQKTNRSLGIFCCNDCKYKFYKKNKCSQNTPIKEVLKKYAST